VTSARRPVVSCKKTEVFWAPFALCGVEVQVYVSRLWYDLSYESTLAATIRSSQCNR
jgi:hypothetical protein